MVNVCSTVLVMVMQMKVVVVTFCLCVFCLFVSVQYMVFIYHNLKEWRKNPKWSLSCCLSLLLPLSNLQGEVRGLTSGKNILNQQLQSGGIGMPSIATTLKDSGALDIALEDHVDHELPEDTSNPVEDIEQDPPSHATIIIHDLPGRIYDTKL